MRCKISNTKKIRKLEKRTGLKILKAMTRGNTNHRIDITTKGNEEYFILDKGLYKMINNFEGKLTKGL